jgi:hypothetical protein
MNQYMRAKRWIHASVTEHRNIQLFPSRFKVTTDPESLVDLIVKTAKFFKYKTIVTRATGRYQIDGRREVRDKEEFFTIIVVV